VPVPEIEFPVSEAVVPVPVPVVLVPEIELSVPLPVPEVELPNPVPVPEVEFPAPVPAVPVPVPVVLVPEIELSVPVLLTEVEPPASVPVPEIELPNPVAVPEVELPNPVAVPEVEFPALVPVVLVPEVESPDAPLPLLLWAEAGRVKGSIARPKMTTLASIALNKLRCLIKFFDCLVPEAVFSQLYLTEGLMLFPSKLLAVRGGFLPYEWCFLDLPFQNQLGLLD